MTSNYNKVKNEGMEEFDEYFKTLPPVEMLSSKEKVYSITRPELEFYLSTFADKVKEAVERDLLENPYIQGKGGCCERCEIYLDYKDDYQCSNGECECHLKP